MAPLYVMSNIRQALPVVHLPERQLQYPHRVRQLIHLELGPGGYCQPRRPMHLQLSFHD